MNYLARKVSEYSIVDVWDVLIFDNHELWITGQFKTFESALEAARDWVRSESSKRKFINWSRLFDRDLNEDDFRADLTPYQYMTLMERTVGALSYVGVMIVKRKIGELKPSFRLSWPGAFTPSYGQLEPFENVPYATPPEC